RAAWRALQACLPVLRDDIAIRFLFLPAEHDPDSYVRELGAEAFRACLADAMALSRFLLEELASRHNLAEAEGRASCLHEAKPLLAAIPECALRLQIEREMARQVQLTPEEMAQVLAQAPVRPFALPASGKPATGGAVPSHAAAPSGTAASRVDRVDDYGHSDGPPPDLDYQPADFSYESEPISGMGFDDPAQGQGWSGQPGAQEGWQSGRKSNWKDGQKGNWQAGK